MPLEEICEITMAIANHEEEIGIAATPLTAALIIADKSDAHRTRVRQESPAAISTTVSTWPSLIPK